MAEDAAPEGKKLEIVKAAFERFYTGGFHATGIDAVMAGSGISKRTLYKYFPSKEDLILAVLDYYGAWILHELFDAVARSGETPRGQILAFFDQRRKMLEAAPTRGCLGIKAAQEYLGHHAGIAEQGRQAAAFVEARFTAICAEAGIAQPATIGRQIGLLFQGALLLAQVSGDSSAFAAARAAAATLLDHAETVDAGQPVAAD